MADPKTERVKQFMAEASAAVPPPPRPAPTPVPAPGEAAPEPDPQTPPTPTPKTSDGKKAAAAKSPAKAAAKKPAPAAGIPQGRTTVSLPVEVRSELRARAAGEGVTAGRVVVDAIRAEIDQIPAAAVDTGAVGGIDPMPPPRARRDGEFAGQELRIPQGILDQLRAAADDRGVTLSELVTEALRRRFGDAR